MPSQCSADSKVIYADNDMINAVGAPEGMRRSRGESEVKAQSYGRPIRCHDPMPLSTELNATENIADKSVCMAQLKMYFTSLVMWMKSINQ